MTSPELRDAVAARCFIAQSLWLQRIAPVRAEEVTAILEWALAITAEGEPLPLVGFVADVGHMIFRAAAGVLPEGTPIPNLATARIRAYEDFVVGKLLADSAFERGSDALRTYQCHDRARGLAFLIQQMRARVGFS